MHITIHVPTLNVIIINSCQEKLIKPTFAPRKELRKALNITSLEQRTIFL